MARRIKKKIEVKKEDNKFEEEENLIEEAPMIAKETSHECCKEEKRKPISMFMEFEVYVGIITKNPVKSKLILNISNISTIKKLESPRKMPYIFVKCGDQEIPMPLSSLDTLLDIKI